MRGYFTGVDPGVVLRNVRTMVMNGGSIIHVTAITGFLGRGYYAVQPRTLFSFYAANGGVCDHAVWRTRPRHNLRRIARRLLSSKPDTGREGTALRPGDVFWGRRRALGRPGFSSDATVRATRRVPNDILGTYVFRIVDDEIFQEILLHERDVL